ncbi:MAG: hypothetical protein MI863_14900 [Desulfobacterales bacterium]|nr:hypothetical protein [Desulfobacterales bacterium]
MGGSKKQMTFAMPLAWKPLSIYKNSPCIDGSMVLLYIIIQCFLNPAYETTGKSPLSEPAFRLPDIDSADKRAPAHPGTHWLGKGF